MSKTTLEDWNTWDFLFNNLIPTIIISGDEIVEGDYGSYGITIISSGYSYKNLEVELKADYDLFNDKYVYVYILDPNGEIWDYECEVNDDKIYFALEETDILIIPLKSDLIITGIHGYGAILPYYAKYYIFTGDDGRNRLFRLNTIAKDGTSINNGIDTVQSSNGVKYCNLSTVLPMRELFYENAGLDLSNAFVDIYRPPLWKIIEPFYIGCTNNISDKLTSDVDLTTYISNKQETKYYIPLDYNKDYLNIRLNSKSQTPYLPMNVTTQIPVITKEITNVSDLGKYEYSKLANDFINQMGVTFESQIKSRLDLNDYSIQGMDFNVENELILENGWIMQAKIINNGVLTVQNAVLSQGTIINNGTLTLSASNLYYINIVNNGKLIIKDCDEIFIADMNKDMPFIHNTGTYTIINNNIECRGEFDDNSLIFIRSENVKNILENNNFTYHITFDNYRIDGNGFIYSNIDDDTLILKNLTSEEVE